ncbi:hypothetical protein [Caulobacter sp. CCG-8]|uniref:hypothetical protein n=1 Tax=Caulobacter sp. CCG-8 TaxID=3127958 RepID=UPI00307FCB4F
MSQSQRARGRLGRTVRLLLMASAACAAMGAAADVALAANTLNIDISGGGTVRSLRIRQDNVGPTHVISANGATNGAAFPVRGAWNSIAITQIGQSNTLAGAVTSSASTTASLSLTYGSGVTGGNNHHSLTIGGTTAPVNPSVTVAVINSDPTNATNTITDVLDGSSLTYALTLNGADNTVANTLAATGAVNVTETINGGALGVGNTVTNTITGATTITGTITIASDDNVVTNTSDGAGAKTFSVNLPSGGADGNTISTDFTGGSGTQISNLTVNGVTSRVDYSVVASGAGSTVNTTLSNAVGAAGAAGVVRVVQTGSGASLGLTVNGGAFTMGSDTVDSLTGGILVTQANPGASANLIVTAGGDGYTFAISQ